MQTGLTTCLLVTILATLRKKSTSHGVEKRIFSLPEQQEGSIFRTKYKENSSALQAWMISYQVHNYSKY